MTTLRTICADEDDQAFDALYPRGVRKKSEHHFTPLHIVRKASLFLAAFPDARVLDIGSGAGKFCLAGAVYTTAHFTGIEQRENLVHISQQLAASLELKNVSFQHENALFIDFRKYNAFYLYNPFFENVNTRERIDDTIPYNISLYSTYTSHTFHQLTWMPLQTRLATYYIAKEVVPSSFSIVDVYDKLICWEKTR